MSSLYDGMPCPVCGEGHLRKIIQDESFEYKGQAIVVPSIESFVCDSCNEGLYNKDVSRGLEKHLADERRKADGLLTSDEIRQIRTNFGYTQVEFARILKVGEKNFARYESGASTQEKGMDLFLRALLRDPANIEVVDKEKGAQFLRANGYLGAQPMIVFVVEGKGHISSIKTPGHFWLENQQECRC